MINLVVRTVQCCSYYCYEKSYEGGLVCNVEPAPYVELWYGRYSTVPTTATRKATKRVWYVEPAPYVELWYVEPSPYVEPWYVEPAPYVELWY